MSYGLTASPKQARGSTAQRESSEVAQAGAAGYSEGAGKGALAGASQGAGYGAAIGTAVLPGVGTAIGFVGGALVGAVIGATAGGVSGQSEAAKAKIEEQNAKRRTAILTRQENTTRQQEARAAQTSTVKTPKPTAPVMTDTAVSAMPAASGKGTAYDAWHTTVYGG